MTNKEKLHQILSSLWKNDDSVGKTYYNQALQDVQIAIDSLQEEPKPKFKVGDRIKFKGARNEYVTRVITDIKEDEGGGSRYFFADGSIHSIGDYGIELVEEHASEGLDKAAWAYYDKNKPLMPQELALHREFVSFFKAGAQWREEQTMEQAVDADCFGFQGAALFSFRLPSDRYLVGSKVKVIVIKED